MQMQPVQRSIRVFNQLLFEDAAPIPENKPNNSFRSPQHIAARDLFLINRFYYKSKIQRKLFQDVIKELEYEVYLTDITIRKIIQAKQEEILKLKKDQITVKQLRQQWPHINWD